MTTSNEHGDATRRSPRVATRAALRSGLRVYRAQWLRFAALALLASAAGLVVLLLSISSLATLAEGQRSVLVDELGRLSATYVALVLLEVGVPALLALGAICAAWMAAVARLTDATLTGARVSVTSALGRGVRRTPAVLGASVVALLVTVGLALLTTVLIAIGLIGIVLSPVVALVRRRRPSVRWPSTRELLLLLVPFSTAVRVAVRWSLAVPAAALERNGARAALRRSRTIVAVARARVVAAVVGIALVASLGVQRAAGWLAQLVHATGAQTLTVRSIAQLVVAAIPIMAITVLFREGMPEPEPDLAVVDPAPRPKPARRATVVVLAWALVGSTAAGVVLGTATAGPAHAATQAFTVDSLGEQGDDNLGDSVCHTAVGTCTLRAALEEANRVAADVYQIGFSVDGTIFTSSPLVVTSSVTIDGTGHRVEVSGRPCAACAPSSQLLRATNAAATLTVGNLTLRDGRVAGASGGAAIETVATTAVTNAALLDSQSTSAPGGAVSVRGGSTVIINTTFHGNTAPTGADLGNQGTTSVRNSTLSGATGSAVVNQVAGTLTMDNTIVTASTGANCTGRITGATNLSDDGTCPGSLGYASGMGALLAHGGSVPTIDITASSAALDTGTSGTCPPTDARGVTRPKGTKCDIGAYEALPAGTTPSTIVVTSLGDDPDAAPGDGVCATAGAACTLRAAVEEADAGAVQPYTITFASGGTIALGSPIVATADLSIIGTGVHLTIDGGGTSALFSFPSASTPYALTDLTLANARTTDPAGGAAVRSGGIGTIDRVTFTNDVSTAGPGGAVAVVAASTTIRNSTFSGNSAPSGADLATAGGRATVRYSTLAGGTGGSIANDDGLSSVTSVESSIVAPASGASCTGTTAGYQNLAPDASCADSLYTIPGLGTLGDHGGWVPTYDLLATSQALDHGWPDSCPTTDARGAARPQNLFCDIGSYELVPTAATVPFTVTTLVDAPDAAPGDGACATGAAACSLRAAIDEANALQAASGATSVLTFDVGFSVDGTIPLASTIGITSLVRIEGTGHRVTIDGGRATRLFDLATTGRAPSIKDVTLANGGTSATNGGGAIHSNGWGHVENVTFIGNVASDAAPTSAGGGAIAVDWASGGSFDVVNSTFVDNSAPATIGGGDVFSRGAVTLTHSTFSGATGGALAVDAPPAALVLQSSLVQAASGPSCSGAVTGSGNISSDAQCPGTTNTDPLLAPLADHGGWVPTMPLLPGSPAIDATSGPPCPATDARGVARPLGAACDLGAVETSHAVTVTVVGDVDPAPLTGLVTITASVAGELDPTPPSGTVSFVDGGTPIGSAPLIGGMAAISLSTLDLGDHSIQAQYSGDSFFTAGVGSYTQTFTSPATAVHLSPTPGGSVVGQPVALDAHVTAPGVSRLATGTIEFRDGATLLGSATLDGTGQTVVSGAMASTVTATLAAGGHSLTASYLGDGTFPAATSGPMPFTVANGTTTLVVTGSPSPTVYGQSATFTATVTVDLPATGTPTGTVTFTEGATVLASSPIDGSGVATATVSTLGVGAHTITAVYPGDGSFTGVTSAAYTHTVDAGPSAVALSSDANPSVLGLPVTFTATVTAVAPAAGTPTGSVDFFDGGTMLGSGALTGSGEATFTTSRLPVGTRSITAIYNGDASFAGSTSGIVGHDVLAVGTTVTLTQSADPTVAGENVTFTAAVAPVTPDPKPTGAVQLTDGGTLIGLGDIDGTGTATFSTTGLLVGAHTIVASYLGDGTVGAGASSPVTHTVNAASTSAVLVASAPTSAPGTSVTFTATVSVVAPGAGLPSGDVAFFDGGTPMGSVPVDPTGDAVLTTSALAPGTHSITAVYLGDSQLLGSSSSAVSHGVTTATSTITGSFAPNPVAYPDAVTVSALVAAAPPATGTPTGSVTFAEGATPLGSISLDASGSASLGLATLPAGLHDITLTYGGDAAFAGSSTNVSVWVDQAATTLALASAANPVTHPAVPHLTATVTSATGSTPGGTVDVYVDNVFETTVTLDPAGTAGFDLHRGPGTYTVIVLYFGDANHLGANAARLSQTIEVVATTTGLVASPTGTGAFGQSVTLTATVAGSPSVPQPPTGSVDFFDGATLLGRAPVVGGVATLGTTGIATGDRSLVADYTGDATFGSSASPAVPFIVTPADTTTAVTASPEPSTAGQTVTIVASVAAAAPGGGIPAGTVTFAVGPTTLGSAPVDAGGQATLSSAALPVGTDTITATYTGSVDHVGSVGTGVHTVDPAPTSVALHATPTTTIVTGQSVTFTAIVSVPAPGPGPATGTVSFYRPGPVLLGSAPVDASGTATFTTASLQGSGGTQQMIARYDGDSSRAPSADVRSLTIDPASTTTTIGATPDPAVVGSNVTLTATVAAVTPGSGAPTSGSVTFTDNGTPLGTVPVTHGVATLVLTTPGQLGAFPHLIGARYAGGSSSPFADSSATDVVVRVDKGSPTVTLTSDAPTAETGQAIALTALLSFPAGAPVPTGTVFVYEGSPAAPGSATLLGSGPVVPVDTPCPPPSESTCQRPGFTMPAPTFAIGAHTLFAAIAGDASYITASSAAFTQTVTATATSMLVVANPPQTLAGGHVTYTVHVQNISAVPANAGLSPDGTIDFTDVTPLGRVSYPPIALVPDASVPGLASATLDHPPFGPAGLYTMDVTYAPAGPFVAQAKTVHHTVQRHDAKLTVDVPRSVGWGVPLDVLTNVTPLDGSSTAPAPSGPVDVDADNGLSCQSTPVQGGCRITFPDPGVFRLTVHFAGDGSFNPATSSVITVVVTKRASSVSATIDPTRPVTGEPVNLRWQVHGPPTGAVQAQLGAVACPTGLAGRCTTTLPLTAAGQAIPIAVVYPGDDHWLASQLSTTVVPLGCYAVPVAVFPFEAGTMRIVTAPNCNDGTGYLEGTSITTVVTLAPPVAGVSYVPVTQTPTNRPGLTQTFVVGTGPGQATSASATFSLPVVAGQCVQLQVSEDHIGGALGRFIPDVSPNCPGSTSVSITATGSTYRYTSGTTVRLVPTTFGTTSRFYGVRHRPPSAIGTAPIDGLPGPLTLTEDRWIQGVFGPACFDVTVVPTGPGRGSVDTPKNCLDPAKPGWSTGTEVELSARATSTGAVVTGWDLGLADPTGTTGTDPVTGTTIFRNKATVGVTDLQIGVTFQACVALETQALGLGTVTVDTPPNCPDRTTVEGKDNADGPRSEVRWYVAGTRLELTAAPLDERVVEFGKWTGEDERFTDPLPIVLDHDQLRRASFYEFRDCDELTLKTEPAGWGVVNAKGVEADDVCKNGDLRPEVPAPSKTGEFHGGQIQLEASATKGNPLVGFTIEHHDGAINTGSAFDAANVSSKLTQPTVATATFCQAVEPTVDVIGPNGRTYRVPTGGDDPSQPPAAGDPPWASGISVDDTQFIVGYPEPNCPYRSDAWIVGTQVTFLAPAQAEGYTFAHWTGEQTGAFYAVDVTFDGMSPTKKLGVTYAAVCHTLTLSGNETDVYPKPNCPGADTEAMAPTSGTRVGSYIGGTTVVMKAVLPDGKVWLGWSGDVDQGAKENPNWVTICPKPPPDPSFPDATSGCSSGDASGNKVVAQSWREKTTGEKISAGATKFFTDAGNAIAVGLKKVAGLVAGALGEFLFGVPPMGVLSFMVDVGSAVAWVLEKMGVHGAVQAMRYAQETVNFMKAGFTCTAQWGLAASPHPPPPPTPPPDDDGQTPIVTGPLAGPSPTAPPSDGLTKEEFDEIVDLSVVDLMSQVTADPDGALRELAITTMASELRSYLGQKKAFDALEWAKEARLSAKALVPAYWATTRWGVRSAAKAAAKASTELSNARYSTQVLQAWEAKVDDVTEYYSSKQMIDDALTYQVSAQQAARKAAEKAAKKAAAEANPSRLARFKASGKKAFSFLKENQKALKRVGTGVVGTGLAAASLAEYDYGWDSNATEAWTDTSVMTKCMYDSVPSYIDMPPYGDMSW